MYLESLRYMRRNVLRLQRDILMSQVGGIHIRPRSLQAQLGGVQLLLRRQTLLELYAYQ